MAKIKKDPKDMTKNERKLHKYLLKVNRKVEKKENE